MAEESDPPNEPNRGDSPEADPPETPDAGSDVSGDDGPDESDGSDTGPSADSDPDGSSDNEAEESSPTDSEERDQSNGTDASGESADGESTDTDGTTVADDSDASNNATDDGADGPDEPANGSDESEESHGESSESADDSETTTGESETEEASETGEPKRDGGTADGGSVGDNAPAYPDRGRIDYEEAKAASGGFADGLEGPGEDDEMPLTEHIEEMLKRLMVVVAVAGVVSVATFPFTESIINFLWDSILNQATRPRLYGVLELLFTKLKVASLAGLIIGLPVVVYETYQFMRPGLYPHERRYYLAAVPTSLVLAVLGVSFAYFVVLPAVFIYFLHYSEGVAIIGFALGRTFDLILVLMGYLAIIFQIPLFILLAMMMGVVTRQWLADRRLLFWGGFLGLSFLLFGPTDPTGASPFLVWITTIILFEGTLFLVKWTRRARS